MRAVQLSVLAVGLAACDACGGGQRPKPLANAEVTRPSIGVPGFERLSWGMSRDAFRALYPSFVQYERSACFEGESALGHHRLHADACFDTAGLRSIGLSVGLSNQPGYDALLAGVVAELDRTFGPSSDRLTWSGAETKAVVFHMGQSGPYSFTTVHLGPRDR